MQTQTLPITGMSCAACAGRVERALKAVPGVRSASVNLAADQATVRGEATSEALAAALARAGYGVAQPAEAPPHPLREHGALIAAALLALPFLVGMLGMAIGRDWMPHPWLQFALAVPVQFGLGARFLRAGWAALRAGTGNMDLLVSLGTLGAFALSTWLLLRGHDGHGLYFEASVLVIGFVLLGRTLESRAKRGTGAAIRALLALRPDTARLLLDGVETDVPAGSLALGDHVVVRPGERIPVDARIEQGEAAIDESALTGESRPAERGPGDAVSTGTLVLDGRLVLRATAVGADTSLARVAALVAAAQASRAPVQKLVDRVSAIFVPVVVALALLTLVGWLLAGAAAEAAIIHAVTVLVIACPCALGLATPAAIMAGTGAAARAGILIRDAEVIERAQGVTLVAFDKTGTLTEGRPRLVAVHPAAGVSAAEALRLAAALQQGSEHPLARAVLAAAAAAAGKLPAVEGFRALSGRGVEGVVEGRRLRLGSARLVAESPSTQQKNPLPPTGREGWVRGAWQNGVLDPAKPPSPHPSPPVGGKEGGGAGEGAQTPAWLIENDEPLALLTFEDSPKPTAAAAIATLHAMHLRTAMLSGDTPAAAQAVADTLGIATVSAGLLPAQKSEAIAAWRASGARVAMVGDGINDAPALAAADLGIAMGTGTDIAIAAAGITLMRGDPALVPAAIAICARTHRTIRQNLVWAFAYNVLGLPLAALGLLSPPVAGAAMALSSVSVLSNALRLGRWKPNR